jgi:LacI family gluconate utilization system Gnt-I transcriptional repressor
MLRTPRADIGTSAAQMLLALMSGKTVAQPQIDLGYELVVRGST